MLVDAVSNDAAPDDAAPEDRDRAQEPDGTSAADPVDATGAPAPTFSLGTAVGSEPEPSSAASPAADPERQDSADAPSSAGSAGEVEVEEASEPWVSPGWTTPREPPGPDEVPLPNLPPPASDEEAGADAAAPRSADRPDRGHRPRLLIAAVLVAVVASALALAQAQDAGDLRDQRDDQQAITEIAGRFGAAYLSFDYAHADQSGKAVTALATRSFAESYAAQSAPGIQQLFSSGQTTTKATTTAVYLGGIEGARARALVVVDVAANSPTDGKQELDDVSFVLDLERTGDGWRVAKVARAPQPELATTTTAAAP
jgi:hypothetical protein